MTSEHCCDADSRWMDYISSFVGARGARGGRRLGATPLVPLHQVDSAIPVPILTRALVSDVGCLLGACVGLLCVVRVSLGCVMRTVLLFANSL